MKDVTSSNTSAPKGFSVGVITNFQDPSSNVRSMLGKETFYVGAVNRSTAIKAPLGANRCQTLEISETHFANKRNIAYRATLWSRTISGMPRGKGGIISGISLSWPVAGTSRSSSDVFP